jgi:hypothetical protein
MLAILTVLSQNRSGGTVRRVFPALAFLRVAVLPCPAEVTLLLADALLLMGVLEDTREKLEGPLDVGMLGRPHLSEKIGVQVHDRLSDLPVRLGFSRHHVRLNAGKEPPLRRGFAEVPHDVPTSDIVGHDALNGAHGSARVGGALGHFLRVDAAVEDRKLILEQVARETK